MDHTRMPTLYKICFIVLIAFISEAARSQSLMGDRVMKSSEWDQVFVRSNGWFGGDGIFAIPLDGKEFIPANSQTKTLFVFGDTMVGNIRDNRLESADFTMTHNSVAIMTGVQPDPENIEFYWNIEGETPHAIFDPTSPDAEDEDYYWLGDGFANVDVDGTVYVFAYRIRNVEGAIFGFQQVGVNIIAIPSGSTPPFSDNKQYDTPLFIDEEGIQTSFGSAIYVNTASAGAPDPDDYIYIYGVRGSAKELVAARVHKDSFLDFEKWEYRAGGTWSQDIGSLEGIAQHVSNEMSLSPIADGRIIMVFQYATISTEVALQVGKSPVGPFFPVKKIWNTPEIGEDLDFFTYNAKGYPHLSRKGHLLISYNINSFDFWNDILDKPNLYRPRFIELKLD